MGSRQWAGGSTAGWRKIRDDVLKENRRTHGGRCRLAVKDVCTGTATCVHHLLGRAVTGDDPRYLRAACKQCNERVGNPARLPDPPARGVTRW